MTAVQQKVSSSSLLAPSRAHSGPGGSADQVPLRRSSSPNPLYRSCPAFDVRRPLYEGYLFKQGHQKESIFNKRYFSLYPDLLVYYKSQADCEHDKEKNKLTKRKQMEFHLAGLYLTKPDKKPKGGKFCWILHTPDPKNHRSEVLLVAASREDRHKWMTKLQSLNPFLHPHPSALCPDSPNMQRHIPSSSQQSVDVEEEEELCVVEGNSDEDQDKPAGDCVVEGNGDADRDKPADKCDSSHSSD